MTFILGTSDNDTLNGGDDDDLIFGLAAEDILNGLAGNDSLSGGDGNDTLHGGTGTDTLSGGNGDDLLEAGSDGLAIEDDLILPGEGDDTIVGDGQRFLQGDGTIVSYQDLSLESDAIVFALHGDGTGSAETESGLSVSDIFSDIRALIGSSGSDRFEISGTASVSEWTGYRGDDFFIGNGSVWLRFDREDGLGGLHGVSVDLENGSAIDAFGDNDSIVGIDTVTGTGFSDTILGDADGNHLSGLSGDDFLDGQSADDTIFAGDGDDTALGGDGADYIDAGDGADQAYGGTGDDFLTGGDGDDTVWGGEGGDALDGGAGNDWLDGGDDGDTLTGGSGADLIDGGALNDALFGGDDSDTLLGGSGNDSLSGGAGADLIDGGDGLEDLLDYRAETGGAGVSVDLSSGTATDSYGSLDSITGVEWLAGTAMNDHLQGDSSNNAFIGTDGSDTISGGGGRNLLSYELSAGVAGYDISLLAGTATGIVGTDWVSGIQDIHGSLLNDTIHGDAADNAIAGNTGDDDLFGDAGSDVLTGGRGDDTLDGGGGVDLVTFGPGPFAVNADLGSGLATDSFGDSDVLTGIENLIGTSSDDRLTGDGSANDLNGADGDDLLFGKAGEDTLWGGEGADSLDGGAGDDQLTGGDGDDLFVGGEGNDTIEGGHGDGDIAIFSSDLATQGASIDLATGTVLDGFGGSDIISGVEHIVGTSFGDVFSGDAASNVFRGLRGNDTIDGAGGFNAVLYDDGGTAQGITARLEEALIIDQFGDIDTVMNIQAVVGTAQADVIVGGASDDSLTGGPGDDILEGGAGDDTLAGGSGRDRLTGGSGFDIADFSGSAETTSGQGFRIDLLSDTSISDLAITEDLISIEGAIGSGLSDTVKGDSFANFLGGGAGDDILFGEVSSPRDTYAAQSYRLYRATLDRDPDQPGHDHWTALLMNGTPIHHAISGFVNSTEFQAKYGATSNEAFVTLLYNNVLDRDPDPGGFASWISFLAAGHAREVVVAGFSESLEFQRATEASGLAFNTSARQCDFSGEIFRLFRATLDRDPDAGGFSHWTGARVDGTSLANVTLGFIGSLEFQATYGTLDNTGFVTQLYHNVLDRAPDPGGLATWVGALNAGLSRSAVVNGFSESDEFVSATSPDLEGFFNGDATSNFRDTIEGGAGNDYLAGGIGADEFRFVAGAGGTDTIVDFERWDTVSFEGYAFTDITEASHLLHQDGGDVVFEHSEQTIRILDISLDDIIFG